MRSFISALCLISLSSLLQAEVIDIDNTELKQLLAQGVAVIDIRTQPEWEETGMIAGSKLLTFFDERGRANPAEWLDRVKPFAKTGEPVVVICRSGNRTRAVSQFLSQQAGYSKVYNVKSGIKGWLKENGPVISAQPAIANCRSAKTC